MKKSIEGMIACVPTVCELKLAVEKYPKGSAQFDTRTEPSSSPEKFWYIVSKSAYDNN